VNTCSSCGASNASSAHFCSNCGAALAETCPSCGVPVGETDRYCPACGTQLKRLNATAEERKLVTVLFADVTGSTALGERLDPERLKDVMSAYFRAMRGEIEAEGGTVEKFIGDAVMAAFGVPLAHEDDASRAVRAAIRMHRRLGELNDELQKRHGVSLEMRVGINTGEVLAVSAPIGGESMVSGDVVNVAARLQQQARPGMVAVSERTASMARDFRFGRNERVDLRGRSEPVTTLVLEGELPGEERGVPGLRAPMVGRDHEIGFLRSVFDRTTAEGRPHLITIYGDPGIGKSRLVGEFLERARSEITDLQLLAGRCLPYGEGVTYWPLAEILKSYCGILDSDPSDLVLEKIAKVARDLLAEDLVEGPERATAALAYTMGLETPVFDFRSLSPWQVGIETRAAWTAFFTALAAGHPTIVVVEDIHWADDALLDVLEELARISFGPLLFLCPARGELGVRRPTWGGGQRNFSALVLDPLTSDDSLVLVDALFAGPEVPAAMRSRILARAEGNPFFLEEIIRKLMDEGILVWSPTGVRAQAVAGDFDIPDTVQGTLAARIDLLSTQDKRVLQRAAVVGRVFWTGSLASLLEVSAEEIDSSLERLRERDLVYLRLSSTLAGEREYMFKHILTRDVAYESLPRRDRSAAHTEVARWIEATAGKRKSEFTELLAHHYSAAYRGALEHSVEASEEIEPLRRTAFDAMLEASTDARRRLGLEKAVRLALDALSISTGPLERSRAHEAAGAAYYVDYRGDRAWQSFRAATDERLKTRPLDRRAVARVCAEAVELPLRWPGIMADLPPRDEVVRYLDLGLQHCDDEDSEERTRLLACIAFRPFAFFYLPISDEEIAESLAAGEQAVEMAARLGDADLESAALDGLEACYMARGIYAPVAELSARRISLAPRIRDRLELGDIYAVAAGAHVNIGNYRAAVECAEKGYEVAIADAPIGGLHCLTFATSGRFHLGDWDGALEHLAQIVAAMGGREVPPMPWMRAWGVCAFIHEARGEGAEADRLIDVLESLEGPQIGRPGSGAAFAALVCARRGDFAGGRRWLDRLTSGEAAPARAQARCDFIAEAEDWASAREASESAGEVAEATGCFVLRFHADRLEGRAAYAQGEPERASALLSAALSGFHKIDAEWERAATELCLAEVVVSLGRRDDASRLATSSLAVFERVGSLREQRRAGALLGRV
jgi:class 3 adenylate cyclase/tetratricopeptide (TPR) repeat protein